MGGAHRDLSGLVANILGGARHVTHDSNRDRVNADCEILHHCCAAVPVPQRQQKPKNLKDEFDLPVKKTSFEPVPEVYHIETEGDLNISTTRHRSSERARLTKVSVSAQPTWAGPRKWIVDSGSAFHIYPKKRWFKSLNKMRLYFTHTNMIFSMGVDGKDKVSKSLEMK